MKRLPVNLPLTYYLLPVTCGCYNGFYFDAAYGLVQTALSHQGTSVLPNDNMWSNVPGGYFGIDAATGFNSPIINWYYRYDPLHPEFDYSMSTTAAQRIIKISTGNPSQSSCTACFWPLMAGMSENGGVTLTSINQLEMDAILQAENDYGELSPSFLYFEKQYAFDVLSNQINIQNPQNSLFLNDLRNGNIGTFQKIHQLIQEEKYDSALLLNQLITPENNLEVNRRWVDQVYLDFIASQRVMPQLIIDQLIDLASASPFVEGDAVYTARAIVNYQEEELNPKSMEGNNDDNENLTESWSIVTVFPNPANDKLMLETKDGQGFSGLLILRNTLGVKVLEKEIRMDGVYTSVDLKGLGEGMYFYELFADGHEKTQCGKLIICR